jgi:hypothetical protein
LFVGQQPETVDSSDRRCRPASGRVAGTRAFASDDQDYAHLLLELSALVCAAGCTSLLLSTLGHDHHAPQRALVDGITKLGTSAFGVRRIRELEVLKQRRRERTGAEPPGGAGGAVRGLSELKARVSKVAFKSQVLYGSEIKAGSYNSGRTRRS